MEFYEGQQVKMGAKVFWFRGYSNTLQKWALIEDAYGLLCLADVRFISDDPDGPPF